MKIKTLFTRINGEEKYAIVCERKEQIKVYVEKIPQYLHKKRLLEAEVHEHNARCE